MKANHVMNSCHSPVQIKSELPTNIECFVKQEQQSSQNDMSTFHFAWSSSSVNPLTQAYICVYKMFTSLQRIGWNIKISQGGFVNPIYKLNKKLMSFI